ncbi:MAG TPA: hypothetical protein VK993_14385 [Chthoniobacterales bacterium]|nr:hypothetical protein [Chthoniobacterales bacterium]
MTRRAAFFVLCAIAAWLPTIEDDVRPQAPQHFAGWPAEWEGEPIAEVPLTAREHQFNGNFPGRIAKFTDGRREIILRWVTQGTRQLHGSADCFRGMGYTVEPQPAVRVGNGATWSCFTAEREGRKLLVRERITDTGGREWTDVSAWYWAVVMRRTTGPWMAATIAERVR